MDDWQTPFREWLKNEKGHSSYTSEFYLRLAATLVKADLDLNSPEAVEEEFSHRYTRSSQRNYRQAWRNYFHWKNGQPPPRRRGRPRRPNRVELLPDGMAKLWATNRKNEEIAAILVDQDDLPVLLRHRWSLSYRGVGEKQRIYVITQMNSAHMAAGAPRRTTFIHRFLLDPPAHLQVDHVNGDSLDNRRENLRAVTRAQQMQNQRVRAGNNTGHRNVAKLSTGAYRVLVSCGGKSSASTHPTLDEAVLAAAELRHELFTHHNEEREGNFLGVAQKGPIQENPAAPFAPGRRKVSFAGEEYPTFTSLVRQRGCGISASTVRARFSRGWSLAEALQTPQQKPGRPRKNFG